MAKKNPSSSFTSQHPKGEGLPVQVNFEKIDEERSLSHFQFEGMPAPDRKFFSDAVIVHQVSHGYRIAFLQTGFFSKTPRALMEIYLNNQAALQFSRSLDQMNLNEKAPVFDINCDLDPKESIAYPANFVRMSRGAMSSVADFYYTSPYGLMSSRTGLAYFDPVVRVMMTSEVFTAIVHSFNGIEHVEEAW